ncbi:hypothetical protein GCM10027168_59060 [Streptomyces capparidis]
MTSTVRSRSALDARIPDWSPGQDCPGCHGCGTTSTSPYRRCASIMKDARGVPHVPSRSKGPAGPGNGTAAAGHRGGRTRDVRAAAAAGKRPRGGRPPKGAAAPRTPLGARRRTGRQPL